jgi:hypothetical protein
MSFPGLNTGIVSLEPLVTYSKRHMQTPLGLPGDCPELFAGRKSLNFIAPSWTHYASDIADIAQHWHRTARELPGARTIVLASTEREAIDLSVAGVATLLCNPAILVDETVYKPQPAMDFSDAQYDAIYNARFEPYKRHELARGIANLALIHDARFDGSVSPHEAEVRRILPKARYVNHERGMGRYVKMTPLIVAQELNQARCGLCLSAVEGVMRASMEYLLCGLPVVSTESIGGRDRYYREPYAIVTPDDPDAIAEAVREIKRRNLNKLAVRDHVGRIVEFERHNFLATINSLAQSQFGVRGLFATLEPFMRCDPFTEPKKRWSRNRLVPVAAALGVTLAALEEQAG